MQIMTTVLLFVASCIGLVISGILLLKAITKISAFLRLSAFTTGFTILALSTSLPELFVGIYSAINNNPILSMGTIIGSNIADLTLVAGIAILATGGIKISRKHIKHDVILMIIISALPLILTKLGNQLSRIDGILLIIIFAVYWKHLLTKTKNHKLKEKISRIEAVLYTLLFVITITGLYFTAEKTVQYGIQLAAIINLPILFVGLFFLAIGTSLPELIFETTAMVKGLSEFALGDIVGSVVTNSTLVIGVTAIITPIESGKILFLTASGFMIVATVLFATFIDASNRLTKIEGISLILFYVLFVLVEFTIKGVV